MKLDKMRHTYHKLLYKRVQRHLEAAQVLIHRMGEDMFEEYSTTLPDERTGETGEEVVIAGRCLADLRDKIAEAQAVEVVLLDSEPLPQGYVEGYNHTGPMD